ncbi:MAG: methyl-accepting chemotaxis protein [Thermincolia bacterium]
MRITVGKKITSGFGILIIFIGIIGFLSLDKMASINQNAKEIYEKQVKGIDFIKQANVELIKRGRAEKNMMLADDPAEREKHAQAIEKFAASFHKELEDFKSTLVTVEAKAKVEEIDNAWKEFEPLQQNIITFTRQRKIEEAKVAAKEGRKWVDAMEEDIAFLSEQLAKGEYDNSEGIYNQNRNLMIAIISVCVILGISIAIYISRMIVKPVNAMAEMAAKIAGGDLKVDQVQVQTRDELRILGDSFNKMLTNLRNIISKVSDSSSQVASTAEEMSAAVEENSAAAQQIAKAIEELTKGHTEQTRIVSESVTVVEQLTDSISNIATGAQEQARNVSITSEQTNAVAKRVQDVVARTEGIKNAAEQNYQAARNGGVAVDKSIDGLQRIQSAVMDSSDKITELGKQSQQIGEIIEVIDDIAEQTNLLALNAAIEAARAGEHGKGFAVVADEVRKLAERSGKAAKEIATLITSIQRGTEVAVKSMESGTLEVEKGVEIVKEVGDALAEILEVVEKTGTEIAAVVQVVNEISVNISEVSKTAKNVAAITEENTAATEQMAAGSGQVNSSIVSIAALAQQSAASAEEVSASTEEMRASTEEIAASAKSLSKMAQELQQIIGQFRV